MNEGFGRRFEDPFDPPEEKPPADPRRGPDETAVEDVRAQLGGEAGTPTGAAAEEEPELAADEAPQEEPERRSAAPSAEHAPGRLEIPEGVAAFIGSTNGDRRSIGIAVARFNGDITTRLLEGALEALEDAGVVRSNVDVVQVPGAFELPLAAVALAKTRRYACVLALGCVIRGDTPHFEYVAGEAASGVQLAALETGVPVAFGVLTCDDQAQAEARAGGDHGNKGAEAALTALEMADVLARLRAEVGVRA